MTHAFGQHEAGEVVNQARTFLAHAEDASIWEQLSEPIRGRMTHADVKTGKAKLAAAESAQTGKATASGGASAATHPLDEAHSAAHEWLTDQLEHARGVFHENADATSLEALDKVLSHHRGHGDVAADVKAYVAAAKKDDGLGAALTATYLSAKSRDAILKDGEHLAGAVAAQIGAPQAAIGARVEATDAKNAEVDALARWLSRWTRIARRVLGAADLVKLGLAQARHHPAHRAAHPAAVIGAPPPAQ